MIQINYRDARPIYEQVKEGFRKLIIQEILTVDEKLPSVREIAGTLAINPNTIQRAYRELEQEGYVYTVPGKGCFVAGLPKNWNARKETLLKEFDALLEELFYQGASAEELIERIQHKS